MTSRRDKRIRHFEMQVERQRRKADDIGSAICVFAIIVIFVIVAMASMGGR